MQLLINKRVRRVKLTKRETDLLNDAKRLLAELANVCGADITADADHAAEGIGRAMDAIARQGEEINAPY